MFALQRSAHHAADSSNGKPVPNQARNTQLTAASLVTSLSLAAMAIGASYGAIALGVGFTLLGLITPEMAKKFGLQPVAA